MKLKTVAFEAGRLRQKPFLAYGLAVAAVLAGLLVRFLIGDIPTDAAFLVFLPAIVISAAFGGIGPGLLASGLSVVLVWYVFLPPAGSPSFTDGADALLLALFLAVAVMICAVIEVMQRAIDQKAALVGQKDVLLTEIHHRLKNQLQFISSMLSLQRRAVGDATAAAALESAARRVRTVAEVHNRLYQPGNGTVDLQNYLSGVCNDLVRSSGFKGVTVRVQAESVALDADRLLPVTLIISELLSNALKHGMTKDSAEIEVMLAPTGNDTAVLSVRDNGPGLPPNFVLKQKNGVGLKLVDAFTRQLGGTLAVVPASGAVFKVSFPI